jgi:RES domain-containing protein
MKNKLVINIGIKELHVQALIKHLFDQIMYNQRYVLDDISMKASEKILNFVEKYCIRELPVGTNLFRARIHPFQFEELRCFSDIEMLGPPSDKALPGRLNPAGIPYLYTSFLKKTAVSEVMPWTGAEITVITFKTTSTLKVVDTTINMELDIKDDDSVFLLSWVQNISSAFSRPVHVDDIISYTPTQYLGELFKMNRYNGVIYNSAMDSGGKNLALFDKSLVLKTDKTKIRVTDVDVKFEDDVWNLKLD